MKYSVEEMTEPVSIFYKLYVLICPIDNMVRYVGITSQSLKERLRGHCKEKRSYRWNWINKLKTQGKKPIIKLVCENLTEKQACAMEIDLIAVYKGIVFDKLTNTHTGGNIPPSWSGKKHTQQTIEKCRQVRLGCKHSPEAIEKMKIAGLEVQTRPGIKEINRQTHLGKKATKETKQKMSEAHKGRKPTQKMLKAFRVHNEKKMRAVEQYDLNGNLIAIFESIYQAYQKTGIYATNISKVACGERKKAGGFIWRFTNAK